MRVSVTPGSVHLDGSMYRLWYSGHDGSKVRIGYAVSPKGIDMRVSPSFISPGSGGFRFAVRVLELTGLSFSARIRMQEKNATFVGVPSIDLDLVKLFDDGAHADSLKGDGLFANSWTPEEEGIFFVDIEMKDKRQGERRFMLPKAGAFTTIGPVRYESMELVENTIPHPGDTILVKIVLRNHGMSTSANFVSTSLIPTDLLATEAPGFSPTYGKIVPGGTASTIGYHRIAIHPDFPPNTDLKINLSIANSGIPFWNDSFTIHVLSPWWQRSWAYALYGVIAVGILYAVRRVEMRRTRLKHEREMERFQAEKLKELDQLKSRFFANISHEFRTPLTLIEGPLKQLNSDEYEGKPKEQYEMMLRNTQRLTRLVNQLLDLSKIESGQMKLRARQMDIVEVVQGIAASFESLAKGKEIRFSLEFSEEPIIGWFDRDAVEKIVTNLLSNAFKFTGEPGEVRVHVGRNGIPSYSAEIAVTDTGIGIPPDQLDKVFDRFYQVDASQTKEQEGTGIGLALTKELVELHKGDITVTSDVGKGTTFTVRLPLGKGHLKPDETIEVEEEPNPEAAAEGRPARPENLSYPTGGRGSSTYKGEVEIASSAEEQGADETRPLLLIVEDNADMRKYMRTHLDNSYRVLEAANGEEGIREAVETIPDLIISDVMMPRMDGFALCEKLKTDERTSHIPIILLTAKAGTDHKIEGLETGADEYLVKPFDAKELQVRVKNLIDQRRKLRERYRKEGGIRLKEIAITSADERFMNRAIEVVESHISDQGFTAEQFAGEMFLSRMQLHRKMRALTDLSPWQFVRKVRLHRAADLLRKRAGNVSDIAYQIGYDSPSRFAEAFRQEFGQTPSDYEAGTAQS